MTDPTTPRREHATGHDPERLAVRALALIASGGVLGMLVILAGIWGLLVVVTGSGAVPTQKGTEPPQHKQMGSAELVRIRTQAQREQRRRLSALGWVEGEDGIARIPIEEAMRLIADEYGDIDKDRDRSTSNGREGDPQ